MVGVSPFVCGAGASTVEDEDDEAEAVEPEELVRCALLRGISIRVTSSPIESSPSPPLLEFHRKGCKLGGDATAVIGITISLVRRSLCMVSDLPNPTLALR